MYLASRGVGIDQFGIAVVVFKTHALCGWPLSAADCAADN
jgi:hypothetical protein